ncbi:hypothetical protein PHISCL_08476 [Aspergillus sclerotialis]|uniref:Uncharacterized protein n=1 Tax=Aspergillus sclerotialis TaxID=2070753 RepID=A0A3A2Z7W3_9EURO|nr:hypothetical protein PHISCL_08476 [Aspergillus sclerotialis]
MKGTSILNRFWPKIHYPLPQTPRENQKLLNALKSSFRRQLDREHPTTPSDRIENGHHSIANPNSSIHATNKHLQTILDNPLFRVTPSRPTDSRVQSGTKRLPKDPMVTFDELVASGSVTIASIIECLKLQLAIPGKRNSGDLRESMKASRAGSRVVSWWWSADAQARKRMLQNRELMFSLCKFMVAEGLQDRIMQWLRMLLDHHVGSPNGQVSEEYVTTVFRRLLFLLLLAEVRYGNGLSSAMEVFIQVGEMWLSMDDRPRSVHMLAAGDMLCYMVMENEQSHAQDIPVPVYERYMDLMSLFFPNRKTTAVAPLYHPTNPNARPFVKFVENLTLSMLEKFKDRHWEFFGKAGSDAIRILNDQGASRDALSFGNYIQQFLLKQESPSEATSKQSDSISSKEDYLLGRLDLT